jgi:hypothetical protein
MKKNDKKKNTIEAQRVFVENLPKPRSWWKEYAFIIAVLALCISIYSAYLSRQEFIAAHRPYVFASPRNITNNSIATMDVNTFILRCLNAPAKIVEQNVECQVVKPKKNGEEEVTETIPVNKRLDHHTLYPSENTTTQITVRHCLIKDILATNPESELRIRVRVDYKELSGDRRYFFEGNWDYNRLYNVWEINNIRGD